MNPHSILLPLLAALPFTAGADQRPIVVAQADVACQRHDFAKMQELAKVARQAIDKQDRALLDKTAAAIRQCMVFEVSFRSTVMSTTTGGQVSTITGTGKATVTLGPDMEEAGYDFAPGPDGVVAPLAWSNIAITGPDCTTEIVPSPPTPYNFWLALTTGKEARGVVAVSADGDEVHLVKATCERKTGVSMLDKMNKLNPLKKQQDKAEGMETPMPLFSDAWGMLYTNTDDPVGGMGGAGGGSPTENLRSFGSMFGKMSKLGTDPDKAAEELQKDPGMLDEEMKQLGADKELDKATEQGQLKLELAPPGSAVFGHYKINRTKDMPGGQGKIQESTEVIITHTPPGAGATLQLR